MINPMLEREDRPAYVRFEKRAVEDKAASLKAGRAVCVDVDFALVTPPYSKDCVEYRVETWLSNMEHNVRRGKIPVKWAEQWKASYEAWKKGYDAPVNGTDVRNWSAITPAQVKNLLAAGCRTVEDLAAANDQAMRSIGMGANELKRKAIAYLQATKDHGPLVMRNNALEGENEQLRGTIDSLQSQLKLLQSQVSSLMGQRMSYEPEVVPEPTTGININDLLQDDAPVTFSQSQSVELETARELYRERFGRTPHSAMKLETIMEKLES